MARILLNSVLDVTSFISTTCIESIAALIDSIFFFCGHMPVQIPNDPRLYPSLSLNVARVQDLPGIQGIVPPKYFCSLCANEQQINKPCSNMDRGRSRRTVPLLFCGLNQREPIFFVVPWFPLFYVGPCNCKSARHLTPQIYPSNKIPLE